MKRIRNENLGAFVPWAEEAGRTVQLTESEALRLWRDVCLAMVRDDAPDLSARQLAILLTVYLDPPPHTVRGLAAKLGVTKPVITRALNAMGRYNLLMRRRDPDDRRNVLIHRTVEGALYLDHLAGLLVRAAEDLSETAPGGVDALDDEVADDMEGVVEIRGMEE